MSQVPKRVGDLRHYMHCMAILRCRSMAKTGTCDAGWMTCDTPGGDLRRAGPLIPDHHVAAGHIHLDDGFLVDAAVQDALGQ